MTKGRTKLDKEFVADCCLNIAENLSGYSADFNGLERKVRYGGFTEKDVVDELEALIDELEGYVEELS